MNPLTRKSGSFVIFSYDTLRNITSPEDKAAKRESLVGHAPIQSVIDLETDANVRDYLPGAPGKKQKKYSQVHKAIQTTLIESPDIFGILNGGITIVARGYEIVDEKKRTLKLHRPNIINGSQTQGIIREFLEERGIPESPIYVRFELIITNDENLIAEVSIARNFQNNVLGISIVGQRGQLDELEKSFQKTHPELKLRKSETDLTDDYIDTEKLLQVIAALTPAELWLKSNEADNPKKVYTYSMKAKCLKDFQNTWNMVHNPDDDVDLTDQKRYEELYRFYLDIAGEAYDLYNSWKSHQGFQRTRLRAIDRNGKEILEVPDGIIFPILASLSAFARKTRAGWKIEPPPAFRDDEIIRAAKGVYIEIAHSNPWNMGKSQACYTSLYQITSIYRRLSA